MRLQFSDNYLELAGTSFKPNSCHDVVLLDTNLAADYTLRTGYKQYVSGPTLSIVNEVSHADDQLVVDLLSRFE
jgi:hypothetical protein